jgi:alkanesulfonate monooxygenase SsuD/methylene tetrahydromethanopterin reductase-like flavin-dependent oxidoreductase (luciferase family)
VTWADGWMPMDIALGNVPKQVGRFRDAAAEAGRDPRAIGITLVTFGDPDLATLASYRDCGAERVVVGAARTGWDDPATTLTCLDAYAVMVSELA